MIRSDFHVEIAHYETDFADLRAIREPVFIGEQMVPPDLELDAIDTQCRHVLARDPEGRPIGTGRLTPMRSIGRLAVLPDWRGHGVGQAMLQALIDLARSLGWLQVELHSQVDAIGFYEKFEFECVGEEYLEAGIRHHTMRRKLEPFPQAVRAELGPRPESREVAVDSLSQALGIAVQIVAQARRRLWLYSRDLDPQLYAGAEIMEAIKRFALNSRGGEMRILLHDPTAPLRDAHPLLHLAQRLSSTIQIRVPETEQDLQYPAAFLLDDRGGYLLRPVGSRFEGTADLYSPGKQRQLREFFNQVWERSSPSPELRPVHI